MPTYYVEDYEQVTGRKPDGSPLAETKVIEAPADAKAKPAKVAEVK